MCVFACSPCNRTCRTYDICCWACSPCLAAFAHSLSELEVSVSRCTLLHVGLEVAMQHCAGQVAGVHVF
jgi:hypothetical protein